MAITRAGLLKTTLLDYPGKVASTIFLPGCNFRCPYCHNRDLVLNSDNSLSPIEEIIRYIESRKNVLEGVCITGGEPLIHKDLNDLVKRIKKTGLKVKLDTNGSFPELLPNIDADYIAMDIKTDPEKYSLVAGNIIDKNLDSKIRESVKWIKNSGIDHEFRTTLAPGIVDLQDMEVMADLAAGCMRYTLNRFQCLNTLDKEWEKHITYSDEEYSEFLKILQNRGYPLFSEGLNPEQGISLKQSQYYILLK